MCARPHENDGRRASTSRQRESLQNSKAARFPGPPQTRANAQKSPQLAEVTHATCPCLANTRCVLPLLSLVAKHTMNVTFASGRAFCQHFLVCASGPPKGASLLQLAASQGWPATPAPAYSWAAAPALPACSRLLNSSLNEAWVCARKLISVPKKVNRPAPTSASAASTPPCRCS